jgi:hypothetical protein
MFFVRLFLRNMRGREEGEEEVRRCAEYELCNVMYM